MKIGIRAEDKSPWERRTPLVPDDIRHLMASGIDIVVQSSPRRAFGDAEFAEAGVPVRPDLDDRDLVIGIKEIPADAFRPDKIYLFFAHVIKGQPYNMPMLRRMMDKRNTLFDYERITDDQNRRLIFFGRHAGLAGMINTLWALGRRAAAEGIASPFADIRQARTYPDLEAAKTAIHRAGRAIESDGVPEALHPLVFGFAGYGNVSQGAQEIFDLLPHVAVEPEDVKAATQAAAASDRVLVKVVFGEKDIVRPKDPGAVFDLDDYYRFGAERYENRFDEYTDHLSVLVNCIYWDNRYPRLLTLPQCRRLWSGDNAPRLRVIGDIGCDPDGAVQCTVRPTDPGNPVYVYDPQTGETTDGFTGRGPVIMAVEILPTEIPRESSLDFSRILSGFIPALAKADYDRPFEDLDLPSELKRAMILYRGDLTPAYEYLQAHI
jgi:alpha-aminoadipic semialdehyde synthase